MVGRAPRTDRRPRRLPAAGAGAAAGLGRCGRQPGVGDPGGHDSACRWRWRSSAASPSASRRSSSCYREAAAEAGHDPLPPVSINSHAYVAETSERAADEFFPRVLGDDERDRPRARLVGRSGAPTSTRCVRSAAHSLVGSPQDVIEKILYQHELFGHQRFLAQISVGTLPHEQVLRAIELFGDRGRPGDPKGARILDHVTIRARTAQPRRRSTRPCVQTLGIELTRTRASSAPEWGDFALAAASAEKPVTWRLHIGFAAPSRAHVDEFWQAGTAAGYPDDGAPGLRPEYSDDYYGAFLLDPDGNSAEARHSRLAARLERSSITSDPRHRPRSLDALLRDRRPGRGLPPSDASSQTGRSSPASAARSRSSAAVSRPSTCTSRSPRPRTEVVDRFHRDATAAGYCDNGPPGERTNLPPGLLRRVRPRSRRQQHRGREPQPLACRIRVLMRTCVRVTRGDDPARRPRRVLRVGRAARRPVACAAVR